jgi:hypothetical protein
MALTRAQIKEILSTAGIAADKTDAAIEGILAGHTSSVDALTEQRDKYKADAEKLPTVQAELDRAKEAAKDQKPDAYKVKYDALKEEYDGYKADVTKKATTAQKSTAYKALLDELKINGKITGKVLKLADLEKVELDDKGAIKDADKLRESLKAEWADFIVKEGSEGGRVDNPPANNNVDTDKMSDDDYYKTIFKKKE